MGVYELPKTPTAVIAQGARVAWDDTTKQVALSGVGLTARHRRPIFRSGDMRRRGGYRLNP